MEEEQEIYKEIERVAYTIYEKRGTDGFELENWLEAEQIVMERVSGLTLPKKTRTPRAVNAPKKKTASPRPKKVKKSETEA